MFIHTIRSIHWFFKLFSILSILGLFYLTVAYGFPKLLPTKIVSNEEVYGLIFQNQIWEGTVRITGDLYTAPGVSISVKPGTKIIVGIQGDKSNLDFLPWHHRSGINTGEEYNGVLSGEPFWDEGEKIQIHFAKFYAVGSKDLPITLASEASNSGSAYDINSISVKKGVLSDMRLSNYRRLEVGDAVTVKNSIFKDIGECAICIDYTNPTIDGNTFENSNRENIYMFGSNGVVKNNVFLNQKGAGIRIDPDRIGKAVITHNRFQMRLAVDIRGAEDTDNSGVISFNDFAGSSIISLPCESKMLINQNNMGGLVSFLKGGCGGEFKFGENYWGVETAEKIVSERILNREANFKVVIPYILKKPIKDAGPLL